MACKDDIIHGIRHQSKKGRPRVVTVSSFELIVRSPVERFDMLSYLHKVHL